VRAAFIVFGFFWGSWAVAAVDAQEFLRFDDGQLGVLLAVTVLGGALANIAGGTIAERWGTRRVLAGGLGVWAGFLVALAAVHHRFAWCALFTLGVAAGGLVDVVMNVAATAALSATPGRLMRCHAMFNGGAVVGAGATGVALAADVSWRVVWAVIAGLSVVLAAWVRRSVLPAGEAGAPGEHQTLRAGLRAMARAGLVPLAVVFCAGALVEGGVDTWGVLFLRSRLGVTALVGAAAYVAGALVATVARSTLGWTAERIGERRGARLGLGLAAVGLTLEATTSVPAIAGLGLALAAIGSAVYWPLLLAHAGRGRERPGVIVGGMTGAGYLGFVGGPPIVGWVSELFSLRIGLLALAAVAVGAALLPLRTMDRPRRPEASTSVSAASSRSST